MRAMWCTLIAFCLVAGGAEPHRVQRSHDSTPTLRVAAGTSHVAIRRPTSSDIGPYIAADAIAASAPLQQLVSFEMPAPHEAPASPLASPRSSRGPPHA
jgi:hypothetical protein